VNFQQNQLHKKSVRMDTQKANTALEIRLLYNEISLVCCLAQHDRKFINI